MNHFNLCILKEKYASVHACPTILLTISILASEYLLANVTNTQDSIQACVLIEEETEKKEEEEEKESLALNRMLQPTQEPSLP